MFTVQCSPYILSAQCNITNFSHNIAQYIPRPFSIVCWNYIYGRVLLHSPSPLTHHPPALSFSVFDYFWISHRRAFMPYLFVMDFLWWTFFAWHYFFQIYPSYLIWQNFSFLRDWIMFCVSIKQIFFPLEGFSCFHSFHNWCYNEHWSENVSLPS